MGTGGTIPVGTSRSKPAIKVIGVIPSDRSARPVPDWRGGTAFTYKVEGIGEIFASTLINVVDDTVKVTDKESF
jgi:cysteine synthase